MEAIRGRHARGQAKVRQTDVSYITLVLRRHLYISYERKRGGGGGGGGGTMKFGDEWHQGPAGSMVSGTQKNRDYIKGA